MKFVHSKLYLTLAECLDCGLKQNTILDAKKRKANCWDIIDDPADRRKILIGYQELSDSNKRLIEDRMGNPYDLVVRMPILAMVVNDWKANEYYRAYKYELAGTGGRGKEVSLTMETVTKYTRAASWLALINQVSDDARIIKKTLGIAIADFYGHVKELIIQERNWGKIPGIARLDILTADFPASYQRLLQKAERYRNEGYDSIIDPFYGNQHAVKLGKVAVNMAPNGGVIAAKNAGNDQNMPDRGGAFAENKGIGREGALAVIRAVIEKGNNMDAGQVARAANFIFDKNGLKTLSRATIHNILSENEHLFTAAKRGRQAHDTNVAMQVKRSAPEYPGYFWTLDGWTVELAFQEDGQYKRLVAVIVLDMHNKYPVGYAIGERENTEIIRQANRNAVAHMKELFGDYYRPLQLQSDRYQVKNLTPFYQAVTHLYVPARAHNAKAKPIEPYFMYLNKEYCQRLFPNWTGFNVNSSKDNQVNRERLDRIKNTFPDRAGVIAQIEKIMNWEREKKVIQLRERWAVTPRKECMSVMDRIMVFGKPLGERTNRITGQGIEKQVEGRKYYYDSFDPAFRANMGIDWQLIGDEQDMSSVVALSPDGKMKFVLDAKRVIPMDIYSQTPEDHEYRSRIDAFNKERRDEIAAQYGRDADEAREIISNTPMGIDDEEELAMKGMFIYGGQQKEKLQDAKKLGMKVEKKRIAAAERDEAAEWARKQDEYYRTHVDFSEYAG